VLIGAVVNRELESLQGKRISEIAEQQKKDPLDVVFDLILADHGQTGAIYFMMSEADMRAAMQSPFVSFCTDSGARATDGPLAGSKSHPRGWGSYPRILGRYVRGRNVRGHYRVRSRESDRPRDIRVTESISGGD
jgi:N-acyl-D-aspartate/D-glutamate deacylase